NRSPSGKRSTFSFKGKQNFGLCVLFNESPHSGAMITAIPVSVWGYDYYAVTLDQNPSIQVITQVSNIVIIHLKTDYPHSLHITYMGKKYKNGDQLKIDLNENESFDFSECHDHNYYGSMSGTYIRGEEPIGIISGSCRSGVEFIYCYEEKIGDVKSSDILTEMLLPIHSLGREFVLFAMPSRGTTNMFMVTARYDDTKLTIYSENTGKDEYRKESIPKAKSTLRLNLLRLASYSLITDKAVQVIAVQRSPCFNTSSFVKYTWEDLGDPSLSVVVPNELFYYVYMWGTPKFGIGVQFFVAIIIRVQHKKKIFLNNRNVPLTDLKWDSVGRQHRWDIGELTVHDGYNQLNVEKNYYFGCYVYALGNDYAYMRPGGAIVAPLYDPDCIRTMTSMKINDLLDNDCDGKVDEEKEDGKDNDQDNDIDEDLGMVEDEDVEKYRNSRTTTVLPGTGCPPFTWGAGCAQSCTNCVKDCLKWNGTCSGCKGGFSDAAHGCNKECEKYKYGKDCTGDCAAKCEGVDCYERVYGECQACPLGYWGEGCKETCFNCKGGCDTSYGKCTSCIAGFKDPLTHCSDTCGNSEYGEDCKGDCKNKCWGKDCFERRFGECKKCPLNKWGQHCAESCINCKDDCDKSYGTCKFCKAGFKNPKNGCNVSCGGNEFGEDCKGNCQQKCGKDCFERAFGSCSESGSWEEWHCSRICSDRFQHRNRICAKPKSPICDEHATEKRGSDCYVKGKCPTDCQPYTWNVDCVGSCKNCKSECDKFNGSCDSCKAGFKDPANGCNKGCEQFEYGDDCKGDCKIKCKGKDCFDRINGTCIVDAQLSEWTEWKCKRDCESSEHIRVRLCNNPPPAYGGADCKGETEEFKSLSCLPGIICPENCKEFRWGVNCNGSCENCKTDCNKVDGSCAKCKAGFQNPVYGCTMACKIYQFGEDCLGDCRVECAGLDCKDRTTGKCPFNFWKYLPFFVPLLLVPLCLFLIARERTKRGKQIDGETSVIQTEKSEKSAFTGTASSDSYFNEQMSHST
ncbi:multiple epidermal growth factor-like domains protein 10, partial [Biomphalaria pfeifferi]